MTFPDTEASGRGSNWSSLGRVPRLVVALMKEDGPCLPRRFGNPQVRVERWEDTRVERRGPSILDSRLCEFKPDPPRT